MEIQIEYLSEEVLRPGDILFTVSPEGVGHTSIYLGSKVGSTLNTAEAVNDGKYSQLMKTRLPAGDYIVIRSKDEHLKKLAIHFAENWATYQTPYDVQRLEIGTRIIGPRSRSFSNMETKDAVLKASREDFETTGKYRLVKYAARRGAPINLPKELGRGRGVWCAMFVLMCYQTAAVAKAGIVKALVGDGQHRWVSDKYHDPGQVEQYFNDGAPNKAQFFKLAKYKKAVAASIQNYNNYVVKLKGKEEFFQYKHIEVHKGFNEQHALFFPSLCAWDYAKYGDIQEFDFKSVLTEGLMLEQKTTDPEVFLHSLRQDPEHWEEVKGIVRVNEKPFDQQYEDDKTHHLKLASENSEKLKDYVTRKINKTPTFDNIVEFESTITMRK